MKASEKEARVSNGQADKHREKRQDRTMAVDHKQKWDVFYDLSRSNGTDPENRSAAGCFPELETEARRVRRALHLR